MRVGILDMVGLATTLIFALPVGIFGVQTALGGNVLVGGVLVAVAVAMVVLPQYLTTPADLPEKAATTAIDTLVANGEHDGDDTATSETAGESGEMESSES